MDNASIKTLKGWKLADIRPLPDESSEIGILMGSNHYGEILMSGKQESNYAMTNFTRTTSRIQNQINDNLTMEAALSSDPPNEDFLRLETIGITDNPRQLDDERAVQHFSDAVKKENGRYNVNWSWREKNPNLPDNYGLALGRLKTTILRLQQDSELLKKYDQVIKDQLKKGIIEIVRDETR